MTSDSITKLFVAILVGLFMPNLASAGDSICDSQDGAAYGLCTAYCEAMDCDSATPHASATACGKVADKFIQITGEMPPCGCPLFVDKGVNTVFYGFATGEILVQACEYDNLGLNSDSLQVFNYQENSGTLVASVFRSEDEVKYSGDSTGFPTTLLTEAEYIACKSALEAAIETAIATTPLEACVPAESDPPL